MTDDDADVISTRNDEESGVDNHPTPSAKGCPSGDVLPSSHCTDPGMLYSVYLQYTQTMAIIIKF